MDCSYLFPPDIGKTPGLHIFRIDAMSPEPISKEDYGKFCVADCYIILQVTRMASPVRKELASSPTSGSYDDDDEGSDGKWTRLIWTWIGGDSEMDKRFCVAMYGVGLKNWIGASGKIAREVCDDYPRI
jgi:hypothetical protein